MKQAQKSMSDTSALPDAYQFKPNVTESHRRKVNQLFANFPLSPTLSAQLEQITSANKENSGKYRRAPENLIQFRKNLNTLLNFSNSIKNEPDQLMALQLRTGLIDLGDNIAVHAACLKDVLSLSHSSVNSYLVNVGSVELPRDKRIALLHTTFLGKYQFLIRQWTVRTKPTGDDESLPTRVVTSHLRNISNTPIVTVTSAPGQQTNDSSAAQKPARTRRNKESSLPQIIRLSETTPPNDLIIVPHHPEHTETPNPPLFKMNHSSLTCVSEPHSAQQLFTNTLGAPCFH